MKCFYHPTHDAVAVCAHCRRGVCPACAVDADGATACTGRCEDAVKAQGTTDISPRQKRRFLKGFVVLLVIGALLKAFGYYDKAHALTGYDKLWSTFGSVLIGMPFYLTFMYIIQINEYRWSKLKKPTYATGSAAQQTEVQR